MKINWSNPSLKGRKYHRFEKKGDCLFRVQVPTFGPFSHDQDSPFFSPLVLIFILYWCMVDLQCCVSFRCTAKWFSYAYTYIHSFSISFPVQVITEYWVAFPVLCSRSLLIIYVIYSSVYMLIPNLIYPSSPPFPFGNHKFVFEVCESVSVL